MGNSSSYCWEKDFVSYCDLSKFLFCIENRLTCEKHQLVPAELSLYLGWSTTRPQHII
jgi:hypothetical protein